LRVFVERASELGDKLGPILFQFPPRWLANPPLLEKFIALLPRNLRCSFEFRDPSWLCDEVYEKLRNADIALCRSSSPDFPDADIITASFVYLRMHGSKSRYESLYTDDELSAWAREIRGWLSGGLDVYIYFNNDARAYAVQNAKSLAALLEA
jgi:uncharacterized protein YecE (DUF72 family)